MSIEEIIKRLDSIAREKHAKNAMLPDGWPLDPDVVDDEAALREAIALLRTHQDNRQGEQQGNGWRSVDDPPKDGEEVLVYTAWHETMSTLKVVYLNGAWWREPGMQRLPSVPTHWRPMPEPPKEA